MDLGNTGRPNSTSELQAAYSKLMAITDLDQLVLESTSIVSGLTGRGVSDANAAKFRLNMSRFATVRQAQAYITNYVLAGSGLGTI